MALLSVRGPGTSLHVRQGMWVVLRGTAVVQECRLREVDSVQVHGPVDLTAAARSTALARGVPVVFLTQDGRYRGRMDGPRSPTGALQVAQARYLADAGRRLRVARDVVRGKILSQRSLLLQHQRSRRSSSLASVACRLRAASEAVDVCRDLDDLRGIEGSSANLYFDAWRELVLPEEMAWRGRTRRPPRDPVNACLSYGYTLLGSLMEGAILATGLLPGAGVLHEGTRGHAALVLDLLEEFRAPVVDRLVLRLVNRGQLVAEDFEDPSFRVPDLAPRPRPVDEQAANDPVPEGAASAAAPGTEEDPGACPDRSPGDGGPDPGTGEVGGEMPSSSRSERPPGIAGPGAQDARGTGDSSPLTAGGDPPIGEEGGGRDALGDEGDPVGPAPRPRGACWLARSGREVFQREFTRVLRADLTDADDGHRPRISWLCERQARRMARVFLGREERYRPLRWC